MKFLQLIHKLAPITKKIRFFKQIELIELKKRIQSQINKTKNAIETAILNEDVETTLELMKFEEKLTRDQNKVKAKLTQKNFLWRINNIIYRREKCAKKLEFLEKMSKHRPLHKEFFKKLKYKKFVIEAQISKLKKELQIIDVKQKRKNNSFLTGTLLILETV